MAATMLDQALELAKRGFHVFPCLPNAKAPAVKGGWAAATRDPQQIRQWWRTVVSPVANIGLSPSKSGLMVIDADGEEGNQNLDFLATLYGEKMLDMTVNTPGGGTHAYLRVAGDVPGSSASKFMAKIDVRGDGGYVLAPGSLIDGKGYVTELALFHPGNAPAAPAGIVKAAAATMERETGDDRWDDGPENAARARDFLERTKPAIEGRGGNSHTYATAEVVRDFGISEGECVKALMTHWNDRCVPPWEWDELEGVVGNAYRYAKRPAGNRMASQATIDVLANAIKERVRRESKNRFRPLAWAEIMRMPDPRWLLADTIMEQSLCMVYGPEYSYKSFVVLDMTLHMAAGTRWCGKQPDRPCTVAYVAGEGAGGIKKRVAAWAAGKNTEPPPGFHVVPLMPLLGRDDDFKEFAEAMEEAWPDGDLDVLVLDTLSWAMAGMDENASKDATLFIARLAQLRERLGCAIILVHHSGKDEKRGARGSSVLTANIDTVLRVEKVREREVRVYAAKQKEAELQVQPVELRAYSREGSLWFQPERLLPTNSEALRVLRMLTLDAVLADMPTETTNTGALATQVAMRIYGKSQDELKPEPGEKNADVESIRLFLVRLAKTEEGRPYLVSTPGNAPEWGKPETTKENDSGDSDGDHAPANDG